MPRLFLDMDGVFFDFDEGIFNLTGEYHAEWDDDVLWDHINANPGFFENLNLLPGAMDLWDYAKRYDPIFLTGLNPYNSNPCEFTGKYKSVKKHFGPDAPVIICKSSEKALYCKFGDVIVDDRLKYAAKWEKKGGVFLHHTNVAITLQRLKELEEYF